MEKITDYKITAAEIAAKQIEGQENPLVSDSAAVNQAKFDALPKAIAEKMNGALDKIEAVIDSAGVSAEEKADAALNAAKAYTDEQISDVQADSAAHIAEESAKMETLRAFVSDSVSEVRAEVSETIAEANADLEAIAAQQKTDLTALKDTFHAGITALKEEAAADIEAAAADVLETAGEVRLLAEETLIPPADYPNDANKLLQAVYDGDDVLSEFSVVSLSDHLCYTPIIGVLNTSEMAGTFSFVMDTQLVPCGMEILIDETMFSDARVLLFKKNSTEHSYTLCGSAKGVRVKQTYTLEEIQNNPGLDESGVNGKLVVYNTVFNEDYTAADVNYIYIRLYPDLPGTDLENFLAATDKDGYHYEQDASGLYILGEKPEKELKFGDTSLTFGETLLWCRYSNDPAFEGEPARCTPILNPPEGLAPGTFSSTTARKMTWFDGIGYTDEKAAESLESAKTYADQIFKYSNKAVQMEKGVDYTTFGRTSATAAKQNMRMVVANEFFFTKLGDDPENITLKNYTLFMKRNDMPEYFPAKVLGYEERDDGNYTLLFELNEYGIAEGENGAAYFRKVQDVWICALSSQLSDWLDKKADKSTKDGGFQGGAGANSVSAGAALGSQAYTVYGGSVGWHASSSQGGAVGMHTQTGHGFAGGYAAKTAVQEGNAYRAIDAVQLGTGLNSVPKSMQVYDFQMMDAEGNIPEARLKFAKSYTDEKLKRTVKVRVHFAEELDGKKLPGALGGISYMEFHGNDYAGVVGEDASIVLTLANDTGTLAEFSVPDGFAGDDYLEFDPIGNVAISWFKGGEWHANLSDGIAEATAFLNAMAQANSIAIMDSCANYPYMDVSYYADLEEAAKVYADEKDLEIKNCIYTECAKKVDKVVGKGLSQNDFTNALKTKVEGMESGAQKNILESVKVNGEALPASGKSVDISVPKVIDVNNLYEIPVSERANTAPSVTMWAKDACGYVTGGGGVVLCIPTPENIGMEKISDIVQDGNGYIYADLTKAMEHADEKSSESLGSAKAYADTKDTETLESAKSYTNTKCAEKANAIANSAGGFQGGKSAFALHGGAAIGYNTDTDNGAAIGYNASANSGGAVGRSTIVDDGGAVGCDAGAVDGFAGGKNAIAGDGVALGKDAKTKPETGNGVIDAIQLGTGVNSVPNSMQVYGFQMMDAEGNIPEERLKFAKAYADTKDAETLKTAKTYTDSKRGGVLADARDYADEKAAATLQSAKSYTDSAIERERALLDNQPKITRTGEVLSGSDSIGVMEKLVISGGFNASGTPGLDSPATVSFTEGLNFCGSNVDISSYELKGASANNQEAYDQIVVDYRNKTVKHIQRYAKYTLSENSNLSVKTLTTATSVNRWQVNINSVSETPEDSKIGFCNILPFGSGFADTADANYPCIMTNNLTAYFKLPVSYGTDVATVKQMLLDKGFYLWFVRKVPIETDITDTEIGQALLNLTLPKEFSVQTTGAGGKHELTYIRDLNAVISELQNAILALGGEL